MANNPMGLDFIEGVLGVVKLTFNNVDLGKTMDEATLEFIEDIKDIFFAQDGTQPADKVPTGQAYQLTCKLAQQTWARLKELMRGVTVVGHNALLGTDLYRSGKDNFAKALTVARVDSDGVASTVPEFIMNFYLAFPMVTAFSTFGPDTQRTVDVTFYMFRDPLHGNYFGYSGLGSSLGTNIA